MVCGGLALAEITGNGPDGKAYRLGLLLPVPGVLGPVLWDNLLWLVVPLNIICGLFTADLLGLILWAGGRQRGPPGRGPSRWWSWRSSPRSSPTASATVWSTLG